ncbi:MAG: hypothetical protein PWP23_878 [Candidatus Sumerlaeota bacterium]|nr:hypothetical protein [Candidatus Sumerlaeota bacterium]
MASSPRFPIETIFPALDPAGHWPGDWYDFRFEDMQDFLTRFGQTAPYPVVRQKIGRSVEGRALETHRFGRGRRRTLIWARQHGDEPECTAALCVVLDYLAHNADGEVARTILDALDILVFPAVNPDGMERCTRQNAVGVDLNREASHLAMPEATALVRLKDEFEPQFSFNLHDMGPRKARESREDAGLVSIAFQAGPYDETNADNDVRLRAKTVIARLYEDMQKVTPKDAICVYKAYYMSRAFGDNMVRWGVPCVLIESGSWYDEQGGEDYVIRVHAAALLAGLYYVAVGMDEPFDGKAYDAIPHDIATHEFDGLIRGTRLVDGPTGKLFRSDLGYQTELQDFRTDEQRQYQSVVKNIGDVSEENGRVQLRFDGDVLVPGLTALVPNLVEGDAIPTAEQVRPWLAAGFTTIAAGFGPFDGSAAVDAFIERALAAPPPIHLAAFERVASIGEIIARHGMSELHGFLADGLRIGAGDLLAFLGEEEGGDVRNAALGLAVYFVSASSPSRTRMVLALTGDPGEGRMTTAADLNALANAFLQDDSQIALVCPGGGDSVPDFGAVALPVLFAADAPPASEWLSRRVGALGEVEHAGELLGTLTFAAAHALRLPLRGTLRPRSLADVVLLPAATVDQGTIAAPRMTVLNGRIVVDAENAAREIAPRGTWILAN